MIGREAELSTLEDALLSALRATVAWSSWAARRGWERRAW